MLLEVRSKVHLVPLEKEKCLTIRELDINHMHNMLALLLSCLVEDLILKIELLCKHKVLLEASVRVSSDVIAPQWLACDVLGHVNLLFAISNPLLKKHKEARTVL